MTAALLPHAMNAIERYYLRNFKKICSKVTDRLRVPRRVMNNIRHGILFRYMRHNYGELIRRFKRLQPPYGERIGEDAPIFVMWYQGEASMPPLVQSTYRSIVQYAGRHPVILITQENMRQYLSKTSLWDNRIYSFVEEGKLGMAHLADLARMCLLHAYGGFWIDATILLNRELDDFVPTGLTFFSGRRPGWKDNTNAPQGRWTSYFFACGKGNTLVQFMYELMHAHLLHEQRFIDYFMMDYSFAFAYRTFPFAKAMVDASPGFDHRFDAWETVWKRPWKGEEEFQAWRDTSPFFKLTYKGACTKRTADGQPTYYAHLIGEA